MIAFTAKIEATVNAAYDLAINKRATCEAPTGAAQWNITKLLWDDFSRCDGIRFVLCVMRLVDENDVNKLKKTSQRDEAPLHWTVYFSIQDPDMPRGSAKNCGHCW